MRIAAYVQLTVSITREDGTYVAVCEELGVSTFDESLDRVMKEVRALVAQHLSALERNGVRDEYFRKHGIRVYRSATVRRPVRLPVRPDEIVTRMTVPVRALAA